MSPGSSHFHITMNCLMSSHTQDCAIPSARIYAMHGQEISTVAATQVTISVCVTFFGHTMKAEHTT